MINFLFFTAMMPHGDCFYELKSSEAT